ncbi:hypothetical protein Hanom_Chr12g01108581 [Helianthus anomalus]
MLIISKQQVKHYKNVIIRMEANRLPLFSQALPFRIKSAQYDTEMTYKLQDKFSTPVKINFHYEDIYIRTFTEPVLH